jgi:hypothetical protein
MSGTSGSKRPPTRRAKLVRPRELWGRRSVAAGVALVALALIGGLILLIAGGNDDSGNGPGGHPRATLAQLQNRFLDRKVADSDAGISIRRPANWKVTKAHGVTNIQSKDRCLVMQLSAPVPAGRADELRRDGISVLRDQFKGAKVQPGGRARIGGVPTSSNSITVNDPKGRDIRVLLSVGTGRKNAYLTEVVLRDTSCAGDLQLAQLMLGTAAFTK